MKHYIKCIQHHPQPWIPNYGDIDRSLEFAFNPADFVRGP